MGIVFWRIFENSFVRYLQMMKRPSDHVRNESSVHP